MFLPFLGGFMTDILGDRFMTIVFCALCTFGQLIVVVG